jgi:methionyl-tRNA formyltransferase
MSLKIVFMGTPEFSVPTLEGLIQNKFNIIKVYTQPPRKSKRGQKINKSPVAEVSIKNKIDILTPYNLNTQKEFEIFKDLCPDLALVVAYGQIIPKNFLNIPKFGFINIHASLLPKWRGAAPIQRAIMNADSIIGISIMKIEEKLDSGPILISEKLILDKNNTHGEIEKKLSIMGANLLIKNLKVDRFKFKNQKDSEATYAKKIDKNEAKINWNFDASKVLAHIHGLSPNPGSWFEYDKERFKVLRAEISEKKGKPGLVLDDHLTIGCKLNSIKILELQRQGKNKKNTKEFLLGKKINKGQILT